MLEFCIIGTPSAGALIGCCAAAAADDDAAAAAADVDDDDADAADTSSIAPRRFHFSRHLIVLAFGPPTHPPASL